MHRLTLSALLSLLTLCINLSARADDGVSAQEIRIGVVNQLTGALAASSAPINAALKVYFDQLNASGGVNGRKITIVQKDDGYEPSKTVEMTQKTLDQDKAFALMGFNGTPTTKAVLPLVVARKVPFLFARTGDAALRTPRNREVVSLRASYAKEVEALVTRLADKEGKRSFALLAQDDAFGSAIRSAATKALSVRGLSLKGQGTVPRSSGEIKTAYDQIAAFNPEVVVLGATVAAIVPFIKQARADGKSWVFATVNNNNALVEKLGSLSDGTIISQVVPNPETSKLEIARRFQKAMKDAGVEKMINFISYETFLGAAVFEQALRKAGTVPTRDGLLGALDGARYEIGGQEVDFSTNGRDGALPVSLTIGRNGKLQDY